MRATTTFSCKDDCILTKHTRRWTYSPLRLQYDLCRTSWFQNKIESHYKNTAKRNMSSAVCASSMYKSLAPTSKYM